VSVHKHQATHQNHGLRFPWAAWAARSLFLAPAMRTRSSSFSLVSFAARSASARERSLGVSRRTRFCIYKARETQHQVFSTRKPDTCGNYVPACARRVPISASIWRTSSSAALARCSKTSAMLSITSQSPTQRCAMTFSIQSASSSSYVLGALVQVFSALAALGVVIVGSIQVRSRD
jgi:hypothetical protein